MIGKKIYSFKAVGKGCRLNGRVCALNMSDATEQIMERIKDYGSMNVNVSELRDQAKAMKEWEAQVKA